MSGKRGLAAKSDNYEEVGKYVSMEGIGVVVSHINGAKLIISED